ncbi:recombinase family protein [Allomesorhizobium alhagi]|uniref:recombinase family protein n=1 Tax=Allomesorhizobium alhagi TaxID=475067 RepID=UPI003B585FE0
MLHIYAAVAEQERSMISQRTKDALAAVKARGVRIGNPQIARAQEVAAHHRTAVARPDHRSLPGRSSKARPVHAVRD